MRQNVKPSLRRCWVEIDGAALEHNLRFLRKCIGQNTGVVAIVKANGFGHGMVPVAKQLLSLGVEVLGVAHLHEARELRLAGFTCPILLLSAALPSEFPEIVHLRAWPMISTLAEAKALARAARQLNTQAEAHFKMDTGMGRIGLWQDEATEELQKILDLKNLHILAIATHFSQAEDNASFTRGQIEEFVEFQANFAGLPFHLANSAASCLKLVPGADFIRVGLALYGIPPLARFRPDLRPALTWKSRISLLRKLSAGRTISYGATYRLPHPQWLATVAVGYGDGYPRELSNVGEVLIGGKRCPIRGRVTMDQIIVDVTKVPGVKVEDEVVLIGKQGKATILVEELAERTKTISYDILTAISARVERVYLLNASAGARRSQAKK